MKTNTPPDPHAAARAAFLLHQKERNFYATSRRSLAKDWTGRGFKDESIQAEWSSYLEGWVAALKTVR